MSPAHPRAFRFVALPAPHRDPVTDDDMLAALLEEIEEEFSPAELMEFAKRPVAQDPIFALVRRLCPFADVDGAAVARMWGCSRETARIQELSAIEKLRRSGVFADYAPEDAFRAF